MKKLLICFPLLFILLASGISAQEVVDKPVAIVKLYKTEVISLKKFNRVLEFFEKQNGKKMSKEEKKVLLDNMVYEVLILQAADNQGIKITEEKITQMAINQVSAQYGVKITEAQLREMLEKQGVNYSQYIEIMKKQMVVDTYIKTAKSDKFQAVSNPEESEIKTFYDNNSFQFINPEMVRISHIYYDTSSVTSVDDRKKIQLKAEETYKKIKAGASFEDTMKSEPVSQNNYNIQNGDLGYVPRGSQELIFIFGEEFANKVFDMKSGSVGLLQSKQGYHIVKITDHRDKKFLGLDDAINPMDNTTVRQYIIQLLVTNRQKAMYQLAYNEIIKELTTKAEIKVFEENY